MEGSGPSFEDSDIALKQQLVTQQDSAVVYYCLWKKATTAVGLAREN